MSLSSDAACRALHRRNIVSCEGLVYPLAEVVGQRSELEITLRSGTVTLDRSETMCLCYTVPIATVFTIKQLHDDTGPLLRQAGASRCPVSVTDRGREVAVIANRSQLRPMARKRTLLPEYEAMMAQIPGNDVQAALDEDRGNR